MSARSEHRHRSRKERSRSRSPARSGDGEHRRHKESKESSRQKIPESKQIDAEKDYFLKQEEFRVWLRDEKGKYMDELTGEKSRSYFKKFVKAWNRGELSPSLYSGVDSTSAAASSNTGYKWSFASNRSKVDKTALEAIRHDVAATTNANKFAEEDAGAGPSTSSSSRPRVAGPTLPSASDRVFYGEEQKEHDDRERSSKRKRERAEEKERIEDLVGPKETGREGMLEKKKVRREADSKFRDKEGDLDFGDDVLMGGGDSFKARLAQRDAARKRFEEKKQMNRPEKAGISNERLSAMKEKDAQTMAMFAQMAKERFG